MKLSISTFARVRAVVVTIVLLVVALVASVSVGSPAGASPAQTGVVSAVPGADTPDINNGTVYAITRVGSTIVVGGSFTSVTAHGASTATTRNHVLAFDETTGALSTTFAPSLDGTVNTLVPGPTPGTVYVGGAFTNVGTVKSKGLTLLDLNTGLPVSGFKAPGFNGVVNDLRLSGGHLFVAGSFTTVAGLLHQGLATVVPATGALDTYLNVQLTGHHNYNGKGASGAVGGRALDITPDGTRAVVVGNFKAANDAVHDQIVMIDLGASNASIDANWNTSQFSAPCASNSFDTYVEDVDFSPDGSYFAIGDTGGSTFSTNVDGSRGLCDSASRWETTATGPNVQPTWVDYTGNDTIWSVAATGTAVYVGGHERWLNNPAGSDNAGPGAVPRPGIAALDPVNGLPLSWNPGRNPRGAGAYALLATTNGLYVGSDTDYIGNYAYKRAKIAYFPLAGGSTPASTATAQLPSNLHQAGPLFGTTTASVHDLAYRSFTGTAVGAQTTVANTGIDWANTRGAFMAGDSIFLGYTDGNFYRVPYNGTTVGTPVVLNPYEDPAWSSVDTGSGQTYKGSKSGYYSEMSSVTGAFYSNGRIYYSLSGRSSLYWRYFQPDSGIIGGAEYTVSGADFGNVAGMVLSGNTLYYANRNDGTLHALAFANGIPDGRRDTTVSAPGVDWRARSLFLYSPPSTSSNTKVGFVGAAGFNGLSTAPAVTVPAGVNAGDTEVLIVSANTVGVTGTPSGWTQRSKTATGTLETTLFTRTAAAGDSGSTVTVPLSASVRVDVSLADYSGVTTAAPTVATATDVSTATHVAPAVAVGAAGSWVLSYWGDRSSTTTSWAAPAGVTSRRVGVGTGSARTTSLLADSGKPLPVGTYPSQTATTDAASSRGVMLSVVLAPAS